MSTKRTCLECDEAIVGRSDKKFCCDQCRSNYFNKQNSDENNFMRTINATLRKNRRILAELNPEGKAKVEKKKMMEKGFNFNYHTNTYTTKKGSVYYFCYDQGYLPMESDYYYLVKRQEYVD